MGDGGYAIAHRTERPAGQAVARYAGHIVINGAITNSGVRYPFNLIHTSSHPGATGANQNERVVDGYSGGELLKLEPEWMKW